MYHLGVDLGGTNIAVGVVDENYNIIGRGKVKTNIPRPAEEICDDIYKASLMAIENAGLTLKEIATVGIGVPGSVEPENGFITYSNNLGFVNLPLGEMLKQRFGVKIYMENDASAAAYGEYLAGSGKGTKNFIAITLGTGVGSGIILDGKLFSGSNFAGGEIGHTVMVCGGEPCTCGRKGCWESYASATALIRLTKEEMNKNKDSLMWQLCGGNIENVNGRTSYDGMRAGDESATAVVNKYSYYVACGITNVINIFQPEVVCIGGGISKEGDTLLNPVYEYVKKNRYSKNLPEEQQTKLKIATLGNDAGIIGAAFVYNLY